MSKKPSKKVTPRTPKTKEQLLAELRSNSGFITRMKFLREQLWPALVASSKNVEDTTTMLTGFNNVIMESFLAKMKEVKMKDLPLGDKLAKDDDKYEENKKLLALFDDMNVWDAKEYIEGIKNEIGLFQADEWRERKLDSLKVKWLDEI